MDLYRVARTKAGPYTKKAVRAGWDGHALVNGQEWMSDGVSALFKAAIRYPWATGLLDYPNPKGPLKATDEDLARLLNAFTPQVPVHILGPAPFAYPTGPDWIACGVTVEDRPQPFALDAYRMALVWDTTAADHLTVPAERNKGELFTPVLFWRGSWLVGGVAPLYYRTGLYDAAKKLYPEFAAAYAEEV